MGQMFIVCKKNLQQKHTEFLAHAQTVIQMVSCIKTRGVIKIVIQVIPKLEQPMRYLQFKIYNYKVLLYNEFNVLEKFNSIVVKEWRGGGPAGRSLKYLECRKNRSTLIGQKMLKT